MIRRTSAGSALLALALGSVAARADTAEQCASASERGQGLRNHGKWQAARKEFVSCAHARCPGIVRTDCEQWLEELDRAIPTVIVSAKDGRGTDLLEVRLFVDGQLVSERADGNAVPLDPGKHELRYESTGYAPVLDSIIASEAEKNRRLSVRFVADLVATSQPPRSVLGYVLGAAGLVALGAFVYLDIAGQSEYSHCMDARTCTSSDADALQTKRYLAWGALGAAAALGGIGGFLLLRDRESSSTLRAAVHVVPAGAAASLRVEF